jgi:hypothetical protein
MEFVALVDLVKTVTKNKVKNIEVLGNPGEEANLTELLYDAISKGKVSTDEEAVKFLYGKKESPKSATYLRTKNRLIRQLVNVSLFVDINQPMFNDRAKAYYNAYRDFVAATILIGRGAIRAGVNILEQVLEQSIKFEFTQLTADITRTLRGQYARTMANQEEHEKMATLHRQFEEKRRLEMLALDYYENLLNYYIVKRSPNEEIHKTASDYYEELKPLAEIAETSQFYYYLTQIGIIRNLAINNCENALEICNNGIDKLKNSKNTNRAALAAVVIQKIACLTQLRVFNSECDECVSYCTTLIDEGDLTWFRLYELYLHFCLFAKRYNDALQIYFDTTNHEKFSSLSGAARDNWQLYGGYLHLLAAFGKLDAEKVTSTIGAFRYARLNNEIGVVDRDKQGMNIPLVLLPILYTLAKGDFDNSDISPDALEKYRKRYLDNDLNRRSAAFLNLLLAFSKREYKGASAEKKIKKELNILATEQPLIAGQTYAVEIIPYEDLWDMLAAL